MKIKKFEGKSEQELLERIRDDLGLSAIILSIKKKPARGLMRLFKKPTVVITAAYEEKSPRDKPSSNKSANPKSDERALPFLRVKPTDGEKADEAVSPHAAAKDIQLADQQQKITTLENQLNSTEDLLAKVMEQLTIAEQIVRKADNRIFENSMLQLFYDSLVEQGVSRDIAETLLKTVDMIDEQDKVDINLIVKIVYNTIINILGEPQVINTDESGQVVAFIGPTGVGKTTTIAKLSSVLMLNHQMRVGLITADTYRIAAVEQLKTYADILGLDIQVVYNVGDMEHHLETMRPLHDVVLIDTAGRSHKNVENIADLQDMLAVVPACKKYLVLSVTTKFEDLLTIVNTYAALTDFDLIFTKLDETGCLGLILNICYLTGKKVSYVTFGQNVPDDIEVIQPDRLAKALLGLGW